MAPPRGAVRLAARGDAHPGSDVDVLVELGPDLSLLDVARLARELEEALVRGVDLVEYDTVKPRLRERIPADEVRIL